MSAVLTIARKELRALFQSPIALVFLWGFLAAVLLAVFWREGFFARGLADLRPLFAWLPVLLIFLVSAISMRAWAEERRGGTLEILLTLPVRTSELVLGKFVAGMALVTIALLLTLPLPLMVAMLGPLDWGPVVGGYAAALLLASTYMALGLCVSAITDNQVVALLITLVLGGAMYLVGSPAITDVLPGTLAEGMRALGTGSRFESIGRGVLDVRDFAYYGSLTTTFLVFNGVFLARGRIDGGAADGRWRLAGLTLLAALTAANALALNLWLAPVARARVDLTANGDFTVSQTTRALLQELEEPVTVYGLFSKRTHPKLGALAPQIRDLLREYEIEGGGNVVVDWFDPNDDEEREAAFTEQYGVRSTPFGVSDRHSNSIVNAWFHLVVVAGDQVEVLHWQDLVEARPMGDDIEAKLRNLEYDLTRAIKTVTRDFQTVETLLAKLDEPARLAFYVTPDVLPEDFLETAEAMRVVAAEVARASGGQLVFSEVDPIDEPELQLALRDDYGLRPMAADLFGRELFYLQMVLEMGDRVELISPRSSLTEGDMRTALQGAIKRGVPGQLRKIGVFTEMPQPPPPDPRLPPEMQPPPPTPDFTGIERILSDQYEVERLDLSEGYVSEDVDVLVVGKPGVLTPDQLEAIDQYLMKGGAILAMAGSHRIQVDRQRGVFLEPEGSDWLAMLESWGVVVEPAVALDEQHADFPQPVQKPTAFGPQMTMEQIPYPYFPVLQGDQLNEDHPILSGVTAMSMPWSSPVALSEDELEGREVTWLMETTDQAWLDPEGDIEPDPAADPSTWFQPPADAERGTHVLGVAVTGRFPSHVAAAEDDAAPDASRLLEASVNDGRLVVLGSSEVVGDVMLSFAQQPGGEAHRGNLQVLMNAVDWAVEDTDLLQIRTAGAFARSLRPMDDSEARAVERIVTLAMGLLLLFVVVLPWWVRQSARPLPTEGLREVSP